MIQRLGGIIRTASLAAIANLGMDLGGDRSGSPHNYLNNPLRQARENFFINKRKFVR